MARAGLGSFPWNGKLAAEKTRETCLILKCLSWFLLLVSHSVPLPQWARSNRGLGIQETSSCGWWGLFFGPREAVMTKFYPHNTWSPDRRPTSKSLDWRGGRESGAVSLRAEGWPIGKIVLACGPRLVLYVHVSSSTPLIFYISSKKARSDNKLTSSNTLIATSQGAIFLLFL